jgi:hypothetical protein
MIDIINIALSKYYLDEQVNDDKMGKEYGMFEDNRKTYRVFEGKCNGRRPLESYSLMPGCEFNMKMDLKEVGGKCVNWIDLTQDRENWWDFVKTPKTLGSTTCW